MKLSKFVQQYVGTALWSSNMDTFSIDDLAPETIKRMTKDCDDFRLYNSSLIETANNDGIDDTQIAHDFWLTRNHHGAGFWDGDYNDEALGQALTKAAHEFGETSLYIGDDGKIYQE